MREEDRLFAAFQESRDPELLGRVYDLVARELLHVALHLVGRPAEAEDLLQETLLAAIEHAERYDPARPVRPWLLGILANRARDLRASAARRPDPERLEPPEPPLQPEDRASEAELAERLEEHLLKLPPPLQPVVTLRLRHGLNATEIAHALGRPPGTVRSQLARGLERLRRTLPAGLAGALVVVAPARGLSAVREAVVSHAAAAQAAAIPLTFVSGALLMKIALGSLAAVGGLALGWALLDPGDRASAAPVPPDSIAPATTAAGPPPPAEPAAAQPAPLAIAPRREAEPARTEPASSGAAPGALAIQARWGDDGTPAAGVVVLVDAHDAGRPRQRVVRTGADGEARLDGLAPGPVQARLLRGGTDTAQVRAGETTRLLLTTFDELTVSGEVVDENGTGIPGAEIWLSERWSWNAGFVVANADGTGRFHLRAVTRDHTVAALAPGRAPSHQHALRGEPGDEVALRIVLDAPGASLRGRVVGPDGAPVAGAEVLVGEERVVPTVRTDDGFFAAGSPPRLVRTDEAGAFRVSSVPLGALAVQARARGFAPWSSGPDAFDPGRGDELLVRLAPEARVHGRVRDAHGRPVAAAWIRTPRFETFAGAQTASLPDGRFEVTGLPSGTVELVASKSGLDEVTVELELAPGARVAWDPVLGSDARLFGTLVDADGLPVEGWTVVALPQPLGAERHRSERTDALGRWSVGASPDELYTLWVQAPGTWRDFPRAIRVDARPGPEPIAIRLEREETSAGRIAGEVVDPRGEPAAGALLTVWHDEHRLWRSFPVEARTGRLDVGPIPPGTLHLEVRSNDHPWQRLGSRRIAAGEVVDLGRIELAEAAFVSGALDGVPEDSLPSLVLGVTNADGEAGVLHRAGATYRSSPLAAGTYTLRASGDGVTYVEAAVEVVPGRETRRDLRFAPAATRRVVFVTPPAARAPRSMWCEAIDASGARAWMRAGIAPDEQGQLAVTVSVRPGVYRLFAATNNGLRAEETLEVTALDGDDTPLRARLFRPESD